VKKLEKFYALKQSCPEFFANRDVNSEAIQNCLKNLVYVALPVTPTNQNLILHKLISHDAKDYVFDDSVKTFVMKAEIYAYKNGPRSGTIFIDDLQGATIWHLFRPGLNSIRMGLKFLQEASPLDVKAIHVLNTVPFLNSIIALIKPYLRSETLKKIHFHPTNMNYEKFYQDFVPKSHLPSDYGGDLDSVEDLHKQQIREFMEMRDYFLMEEQQQNLQFDEFADEYDENRRRKINSS
jgi:RNAse (barnase) inhibitor barstar